MGRLDVLPPDTGGRELRRWLTARAQAAFAQRRREYESVDTPARLRAYQSRRRRFFLEQIGGLPRRGPLHARTVGELAGPGLRVEKVVFESQPGLLVTGNLYLPATAGPHPAVLVPCGHNNEGKAAAPHQRLCMLLAANGLATFCYDPIGQGERYQFLTESGTRRYWPTLEHTLLGMGCILLGTNTARYRIHDGMRALDYLQSRADIDGSHLGCTGYSGGGTLTSYLMALDPRVGCAAPCCYLASLERVLATLGPQDAEQNIHGQVAFGLDHADYLLMRAPAPTLICAATRDFFPIDGAWQVFREAKRMYARLGCPEHVDLVEDDVEHDYSRALRLAVTRWMRRWLLGSDGTVREPDLPIFSEAQLRCTPKGQVLLETGARTAFDLNAAHEQRLAARRRRLWRATAPAAMRQIIRAGLDLPELRAMPGLQLQRIGSMRRRGYRIDRLLLHGEHALRLPALMFVPPQPRPDALLYVHGAGKATDAGPGGPLAARARAGQIVLALDVRGCGETAMPHTGMYAPDVPLAYLLGLSVLGMRTADILAAALLLQSCPEPAATRRIHLLATGDAAPAALHAIALEPGLFAGAVLRGGLVSWSRLVHSPAASLDFLAQTLHGALRTYDLPDLVGLAPPRSITIEEPLDPREVPVQA